MFVSLSQQTEKMGERMNSAMNHRRGGGLWKMIRRTDPLITEVNLVGYLGRRLKVRNTDTKSYYREERRGFYNSILICTTQE